MLNVTRAVYSTGNKVRTAPLYQWDYGQILQFEGLDLPANFEAHFSNTPMTGTAITVIGNDNRADIPDSLLQSGGDIWCWVYLHDEVTDGETEYVAVIPVTARPKRDGTEPTPEEQDAIAAAIEALNDATEVLDDAIAHTETYRDQAEAYAIQSESWAIGGTDTRQGEDTDNAKYYRDQAEATAQRVTEAVDDFVDTTVPQAIQSVEDEGTAQIALVDAEGTAQIGAVGDEGTAQIALVGAEGTRQVGIVSGEGTTQKGNVAAEGSAQVGNVRSEGNTQIGLVQSEGSTQIGYVESAGTTQVGNVNSAGASQVSAVQSAGSAQIGLVQAEGTAQISAVGSAGTTQIGLVGDKGTEQIGLVQAEGATQIAAIEAKGEEVLSEMIDKAPIITDTASGAIASFPDGADDMPVKSLTVGIEPVQDLHGYDAPWPAGGRGNLLLVSAETLQKPSYFPGTWDGTTVAQGENAITVTRGNSTGGFGGVVIDRNFEAGQYTFSCKAPVTTGGKAFYWGYYADGVYSGQEMLGIKTAATTNIAYTVTLPENTTSVFFKMTGIDADVPITFTELQFEKGSTATAYAPYSNICPITGWTGASLVRTGINRWDEAWDTGSVDADTGALVSIGSWLRSHNLIPVVGGQSVYLKCSTSDRGWLYAYDENGNFLKTAFNRYGYATINFNSVVAIPDGVGFIRFLVSTDYGTTYKNDISINYPATDNDYHSGTGNHTYPITWQSEAGTVYGGTLTINESGTGTLVADMAYVDLGTLTWTTAGSGRHNTVLSGFPNIKTVDNTHAMNAICSQYYASDGNGVANKNGSFGMLNGSSIQINDGLLNGSSAEDFKAAMNGVQMVYELATPVTYTLTAAEMTTLLGTNNWWADCGDVSINYRADTKLYIDKKLAALLAALS